MLIWFGLCLTGCGRLVLVNRPWNVGGLIIWFGRGCVCFCLGLWLLLLSGLMFDLFMCLLLIVLLCCICFAVGFDICCVHCGGSYLITVGF